MTAYYTAIIFLSVFSMIVMEVCVAVSNVLDKERKRLFGLLFLIIAVSALCEWTGLALDGGPPSTRVLHIAVKAVELSAAPVSGLFIAYIVDKNEAARVMTGLFCAHAALELLSGFLGFIYCVDENNIYHHANFYWIYIAVYLVSVLYAIYAFFRNLKRYQYNGAAFLILIMLFILAGIMMQLCSSELKVDYITLAFASTLLYIFDCEMIQQTDAVTSLINRRGYENHISNLRGRAVVLMFDVDKFKFTNDTFGHQFGDHCLNVIGRNLRETYGASGKCFRTGGDEFCVIMTQNLETVDELNAAFHDRMERLRSCEKGIPYVSIGYALYEPEQTAVEDVVSEADAAMYRNKQEYRAKHNRA